MNMVLIAVLALCFGILVGEDAPALPLAAQSQLQGFDHIQARLKKDYQDKLDAAEQKVIKSLTDMEKAEGRDGHLDMAINLKQEVDRLQAEIDKRDAVPPDFPQEMVGTWHTLYENGCTRTISIDENGNVSVIASAWDGPGFRYAITPDPKSNNLIGHCDSVGRLEVYTMDHGSLTIQHWGDASLYGVQPCNHTAVGTRIEDPNK